LQTREKRFFVSISDIYTPTGSSIWMEHNIPIHLRSFPLNSKVGRTIKTPLHIPEINV